MWLCEKSKSHTVTRKNKRFVTSIFRKVKSIVKLELVSIDVRNKKSSVKDHCLLSGHVCSFDDFTVLNYESHKFKRLIKESSLKL